MKTLHLGVLSGTVSEVCKAVRRKFVRFVKKMGPRQTPFGSLAERTQLPAYARTFAPKWRCSHAVTW